MICGFAVKYRNKTRKMKIWGALSYVEELEVLPSKGIAKKRGEWAGGRCARVMGNAQGRGIF